MTLADGALTVAGTADVTNFTVASAQGTDGQVLTSTGSGVGWEDASGGGGVTLTGSTDNTITTVTGADAIQGESTLTYDGSKLKLISPGTTTDAVYVEGSQTSGHVGYFYSNSVHTGNCVRAYMDGASSTGAAIYAHTDGSGAAVEGHTTGVDYFVGRFYDGAYNVSMGRDNVSAYSGDTEVDLYLGRGAKDIITGGGVSFNSDTAAANMLDDYEEGTWTPTLYGTAGAVTYTTQAGWYTKVGNIVSVGGTIIYSGDGANANAMTKIGGLPFTSNSTGNMRAVGSAGSCTVGESWKKIFAIDPGVTYVWFVSRGDKAYSHNSDFADSGYLYGWGCTYET
jgi:hypothetical protein